MKHPIIRFITRVTSTVCGLAVLAASAYAQGGGFPSSFTPTVQPTNLPSSPDLGVLLTRVINYFLGLVGLLAVLMLVIGGIRYITSGGNEQTIEKAKNTILYAIIGIIIVLLSYAIVFTITSSLRSL